MEMTKGVEELIERIKKDEALNDYQRAGLYVNFQSQLKQAMMMAPNLSADDLFDCAATEAKLMVEIKNIIGEE